MKKILRKFRFLIKNIQLINNFIIVQFGQLWLNILMKESEVVNATIETSDSNGKTKKNSNRVDINILLNKVRANQKKEKIENVVFFGLVGTIIVVTGIIISF